MAAGLWFGHLFAFEADSTGGDLEERFEFNS